jgi:hypothetical protein
MAKPAVPRPTAPTSSRAAQYDEYLTGGQPTFQLYIDVSRTLWSLLKEWRASKVARLDAEIRRIKARSETRRANLAQSISPLESESSDERDADVEGAAQADAEFLSTIYQAFRAVWRDCPPGTLFGDLLLVVVAPLLEAYQVETNQQLDQQAQIIFDSASDFAGAPSLAQTRRMIAPVSLERIANLEYSEAARVAASKRLVDWIGRAIHPARWKQVRPNLETFAKLHKQPAEAELQALMSARIFEAAEVAGAYRLAQEEAVRLALRARLGHLATQDLIGPEWRRGTRAIPFEEEEHKNPADDIREIERRLTLDSLIARAGLSPREAELFALVRQHGSMEAVAHHLGIKQSTARVLSHRAGKRIRGDR